MAAYVHLIGVYLTGVYLMGVYFINVHLTGVHLIGVYSGRCNSAESDMAACQLGSFACIIVTAALPLPV